MRFSTAQTNITPDKPVFMHGYGKRDHKSEGMHDPLFMKAVLLQSDSGKSLLLVTIDSLGSDRSFTVGIKNALQEHFGLHHADVMINYSHTHHSVFLTGRDPSLRRGGYSMGQTQWPSHEDELDYTEDELFYDRLEGALLEMVRDCYANLVEGQLLLARADSNFGVSRRRPNDQGSVDWKPYYEGVIDRDLFVLKLVDSEERLKAILYNYGCHTTAMGAQYLFSNDFAGKTSSWLEEAYPGAAALFLQGCGGEIKPMKGAVGDSFKACSYEEMEEAGVDLANEVAALLEHGEFTPVRSDGFRSQLLDPQLYTERLPNGYYERIMNDSAGGEFYQKSAERTIQAIQDGSIKDRLPYYINIWQLDDETRIIGMEGEVSTQYGLMIKNLFGNGQTLVLGYTNGVFCYVPTAQMIHEGGYEATCNFFFGLHGPFVPEIEDIIVGQIAKAVLTKRSGE
ncbi:neutral/alkaline non-lysosomal ceramidase N-terminal domain-containing protein [Paenibacillus koleovorans]|uniref:neutral/alkaline non-lysosomal ceramidase N-terminal domain-containing protein n=1 Tax=Paenibacillus koleovorans TaxID=121608 RepID=UPI000FD9D23E|nr:neutral/alkaline non-lysosomal ceramidase N-terminal domain-containing protein [Paenibacillus koleovorans]